MNNYGVIIGIISILIVVVITSGCTLISAKPTCPVCNSTDNVVSHVDKYKTTDFKCEKCDSVHFINNTIANFPEAGWDIGVYKIMSTGGNFSHEAVFIGDSGKKYTSTDITAYRQKKDWDFKAIYFVQNYKDPQGFRVVDNVNAEVRANAEVRRTHWSAKQINNEYYEVKCTMMTSMNGTDGETAKWKVNAATGKIEALDKKAEAYMT